MAGAPIRRARRAAKAALMNTPYIPPSLREKPAPKPEPAPVPKADDGWVDEPERALDTLASAHKDVAENTEAFLEGGKITLDEGLAVDQKQFDQLVDLAFKRALDIMKIKPGDEEWTPQIGSRQTSIIVSVTTTLARIDEARLRRQRESGVSRVLDEIRRQKKILALG